MHRWHCHLAWIALALGSGCAAPYPPVPHRELADRILQPVDAVREETTTEVHFSAPKPTPVTQETIQSDENADESRAKGRAHPAVEPEASDDRSAPRRLRLSQASAPAEPLDSRSHSSPQSGPLSPRRVPEPKGEAEGIASSTSEAASDSADTLTLAAAIDLAYRCSPALAEARARVEIAKAGKDIAYADFLPELATGYRHIAGATQPTGFGLPTIASGVGNVSFGGTAEEFDMAELRAQWTVWDFGRTTSRFGQSLIGQEIAGLQYVRGQQSVSYEVACAYFDVLAAQAATQVADESVRRAQSVLIDAKNYFHRGNAIRNDVLRAEVFMKEMQLELIKSHTATGVAVTKLNRAIGINPSSNTKVVELADAPCFEQPLAECLQMAVENRREFGVVERGIAKAKLGANVAQADFMPKVIVGALGALEQEHDPTRSAQHGSAGVAIELGLFQGGRRVAEVHQSQAEIGLALASGKRVCDQIAYEVNVAYLSIADAQERIKVSRAAAAQASENLRVVKSNYDQGDAIPTDVIDAELTLTRAQQGYLIATYDYQTALARLAYSVGLPPENFLAVPAR